AAAVVGEPASVVGVAPGVVVLVPTFVWPAPSPALAFARLTSDGTCWRTPVSFTLLGRKYTPITSWSYSLYFVMSPCCSTSLVVLPLWCWPRAQRTTAFWPL